jgi:hypothetical protein
MEPRTYRSVIVQPRPYPQQEPFPDVPPEPGDVVAMDDREEMEELVSLLLLREDRRWGAPPFTLRRPGKEAAA